MKRMVLFSLVLGLATVGCAGILDFGAPEPADLVFLGSNILTVDAETEGAEAVAVRGDTIVAVGVRRDVEALIGEQTRVIELGDHALTPGYIDAHGHLALAMIFLDLLNASSPPVGPMKSVEDIVEGLRQQIIDQAIPPGKNVIGYGYDDSLLEEGRHPTRDDLDRVSTEHPVAVIHVSGHLATVNSAALEKFKINEQTPNPPGGMIRRRPGTQEPNGVLEETAAFGVQRMMAAGLSTPEKFASMVFRTISDHARYGITTIQDGASSTQTVAGLRALAATSPFPADVAAYIQVNNMKADAPLEIIGFSPDYENGLRVAGVKFILDGSPQGRTAWLTRPYDEGPPGADADYMAYPVIDPDHYKSLVVRMIQGGIPVLAHANGDAAIDLMIEGVELALAGNTTDNTGAAADITDMTDIDHRSVTIHAQLAREDQLDDMKRLGIVPSFFAAHPYFWGDWHRKSFGDDRALRISPMRSAIDRDLPFTIHNDAPVVPPDIMRLLEIAVERRTRKGFILGANQRISVEEALHAVTLGAAYGYFEEDRKGSISVGKQADLVVLGADPRRVASDDISEIEILETFARGRSIYLREEANDEPSGH